MTEAEWKARWPDFTIEEIYSPDALANLAQTHRHIIDFKFLDLVQAFRRDLKKPLKVNFGVHRRRGVRTPHDNYLIYKESGGNPLAFSFHTAGKALDISCDEISPEELLERARAFKWNGLWFTGIGLYDTWLHIDMGPRDEPGFFFWDKRKRH